MSGAPKIRGFLQADNVDLKRYMYTDGDPVNFTDPSGHASDAAGMALVRWFESWAGRAERSIFVDASGETLSTRTGSSKWFTYGTAAVDPIAVVYRVLDLSEAWAEYQVRLAGGMRPVALLAGGVFLVVQGTVEGGVPGMGIGASVAVGLGALGPGMASYPEEVSGFASYGAFGPVATPDGLLSSVEHPPACVEDRPDEFFVLGAAGATVGLGVGVLITNATSVSELRGFSSPLNINTPLFSFGISTSNGIWQLYVEARPILSNFVSASVSTYPTWTWAQSWSLPWAH